jgi:hypothetical protein
MKEGMPLDWPSGRVQDPRRLEVGVTLLAVVLILSPLLQWLYLTVLARFTLLPPPFTHSRGLVLAMQLFFAPGNVLAVALGVGLMLRSEWARRICRFVCLVTLLMAVWFVGAQVQRWRFDPNTLLAGATLVMAAIYLWFFGRAGVRQRFAARAAAAGAQTSGAAGSSARSSRRSLAVIVCGCLEIIVGLAAAALAFHLWTVFGEQTLLDDAALGEIPAEDGLLRMFVFVVLALLLSPHLLTLAAAVGLLLGRDTAGMARRHSLIACWTAIGGLLFGIWLMTHPELSFDARNALVLGAFCGISLVWHLGFVYVLARGRLRSGAAGEAGPARP